MRYAEYYIGDNYDGPYTQYQLDVCPPLLDQDIHAQSLHRLIEIMPNEIGKNDAFASLIVSNVKVQYYLHDVEYSDQLKSAGLWKEGNTYDNIIDCIEWLIKDGYFNKEYLV